MLSRDRGLQAGAQSSGRPLQAGQLSAQSLPNRVDFLYIFGSERSSVTSNLLIIQSISIRHAFCINYVENTISLVEESPMTKTKSIYLAMVAVLLSPTAHADLFTFSYDTGVGVLSGQLDGILQGDGDTVEVSDILGIPQLDGSDLFPMPFVGSLFDYEMVLTFSGIGPGIVSLSGSIMDIIACDVDSCDQGFLFSNILGDGIFASSFADGDLFDSANWSLTAVSVPEPGTLALLGIGLLGMGMSRRKKV